MPSGDAICRSRKTTSNLASSRRPLASVLLVRVRASIPAECSTFWISSHIAGSSSTTRARLFMDPFPCFRSLTPLTQSADWRGASANDAVRPARCKPKHGRFTLPLVMGLKAVPFVLPERSRSNQTSRLLPAYPSSNQIAPRAPRAPSTAIPLLVVR
jgi:hypothetical protein